ncbi:MAG: hypothetical protein AB7N76_01870 [Planctomycetota bacterium]
MAVLEVAAVPAGQLAQRLAAGRAGGGRPEGEEPRRRAVQACARVLLAQGEQRLERRRGPREGHVLHAAQSGPLPAQGRQARGEHPAHVVERARDRLHAAPHREHAPALRDPLQARGAPVHRAAQAPVAAAREALHEAAHEGVLAPGQELAEGGLATRVVEGAGEPGPRVAPLDHLAVDHDHHARGALQPRRRRVRAEHEQPVPVARAAAEGHLVLQVVVGAEDLGLQGRSRAEREGQAEQRERQRGARELAAPAPWATRRLRGRRLRAGRAESGDGASVEQSSGHAREQALHDRGLPALERQRQALACARLELEPLGAAAELRDLVPGEEARGEQARIVREQRRPAQVALAGAHEQEQPRRDQDHGQRQGRAGPGQPERHGRGQGWGQEQ